MSCCNFFPSCGCGSLIAPPCPSICTIDGNTFQNINLQGEGLFASVSSGLVSFYGIEGSQYIDVTFDAVNKAVQISLDAEAFAGGIPQATESVLGGAKIATQTQTNVGTDDATIVTPLKLSGRTSTTARTGVAALATQGEVNAGTNNTKIVTPLTLATLIYGGVPSGTVMLGDTSQSILGQTTWDFDQALSITIAGISFLTLDIDTGITFQNGSVTFLSDITSSGGANFSGAVEFSASGTVQFDSGTTIDFQTGTVIQVASVAIPANSVFITSGVAGHLSSALISTFASTANVQTGWTPFSNGAVLRTCDTATVTLPQLAQIVGTLIEQLKTPKLPAT